ncbi:HAD family hydrolase [Castellaniella hirudinis]|uniref:HAD family hydrolase n=1 Tax=Castellaniella hirudinis TaxID=1144617 RepID=A0ABV8RWX3_9BURK
MDTSQYKAITFDFWGTLVDVETSGVAAMEAVAARLGADPSRAAAYYQQWDEATVRGYRSDRWRPYVEWAAFGLRQVFAAQAPAGDWPSLAETFVADMTRHAQPHPEAPDVIRFLGERYRLMPITNMDRRFFDANPFRSLFALTLTAEDVRAFKPSALIFKAAIERLALEPGEILHVSLAQFADLEGAMPMGMDVAWINRGGEPLGRFTPAPKFEFSDLSPLVGLLPGSATG